MLVSPTPGGSHGVTKYLGPLGVGLLHLDLGERPAGKYKLTLDLYIILSWDGNGPNNGPDRFLMQVDGANILFTNFANLGTFHTQAYPTQLPPFGPGAENQQCAGAFEVNTLGFKNASGTPMDSVYRITYEWEHAGGPMNLECHGGASQGFPDEYWGLDNIQVELLSTSLACYADCDGSGDLNIDDFICFQTLFALGC